LRSRNRLLSAIGAGAVVVLAGGGIVGAWMLRPAAPQPDLAESPRTTASAATTVQVGTGGPGIMSEREILGQIVSLLPEAQVQDPEVTVEEIQTTAVLTLTTATGSGQFVVGVQAASDPARLVCHDIEPPRCQVETVNGATVRSLTLDDGELRVDAGFGDTLMVYIEVAPGLLTREQGVAFVGDPSWVGA
jgi:hypothetical protein